MAGKTKDFSGISTGVRVASAIDQATSARGRQSAASPEEAAERANNMKTQGRKGCKLHRYNVAFTPDNYQFISVMSMARGENRTAFVNFVLDAYQKEHPEILAQAQAFIDMVNSMGFSGGKDD